MQISKTMSEEDIGAVVVLRGKRIVGIVSERDIVRRMIAEGLRVSGTKARHIMTRRVITAQFRDGLNKIHEMMCKVPFRHLPIIDGDKLVGIVSNRDILYSLKRKKG